MAQTNIINRMREGLQARLRSFVLGEAVVQNWERSWGHEPVYTPEEFGDYIIKSNTVYTCATLRAQMLAGLPLKLLKNQTNGKAVKVETGPAYNLFQKVNPHWTWNRMVQQTELSLCLWGKNNWFLERGEKANLPPQEIWWAKPSRVIVVPHPVDYIEKFVYQPLIGVPPLAYTPQEVVWFRYPNPLDEFDGLSPIAASRLSADTSVMAMKSNYGIFKNGLSMGGLIVPKPGATPFTPDQAQLIEKQLESRFKGEDKAHRWGVLRMEAQIMSAAGITPKEAEFTGLLSMTLEEICRAFKVPLDLIGGQRTYANVESSRALLWEECLIPEAQFLENEIKEQLLPMFGDDSIYVKFDLDQVPVLQEAKGKEWARDRERIQTNVITINEWRKKQDMEPFAWGDEPYDKIVAEWRSMGGMFGGGADGMDGADAGNDQPTTDAPAGAPTVEPPEVETPTAETPQRKTAGKNKTRMPTFNAMERAEAQAHTGVMVGFFLGKAESKQITDALKDVKWPKGAELQDELHLTLVYLGDAEQISGKREDIGTIVKDFAKQAAVMIGKTQGIGYFNAGEGSPYALYASFDGDGLAEFRTRLVSALTNAGFDSPSDHDFVPHITLAYIPDGAAAPFVDLPNTPIAFDKITLAWGGEHDDYTLKARSARKAKRAVAGPAYGSIEHRAMLARFDQRVAAKEKALGKVVAEMLRRQQDSVMAALQGRAARSADSVAENPFSKPEWVKKFREAVRPAIRDIVNAAGDSGLEDIGVKVDFKMLDPNVVRFIETRAQRFSVQVNDTTWNKLRDSLSQGIQAGEGVDKLAARVNDTMTLRIGQSAEVIARTEVVGAENGGMLLSWRQSDIVSGKTWLATMTDGRTRETHVEAHGQTVALDEDFEVGDGAGPAPGQIDQASESVNCRCTMMAVVK